MNPITARPTSDVSAPEEAPSRRSVAASVTWAAPVVVTAALGLFEIGVPQLWRDELASWSAASRTLPQLWAMVHNIDAVLGVYYLGLHLRGGPRYSPRSLSAARSAPSREHWFRCCGSRPSS